MLKSSRNTYMQAQGTSEHVTMLCAASAAFTPNDYSFQVFPRWSVPIGGPDDALYAKSDS